MVNLINISMAWRLPFGAHLAVQTATLALLMCFAVHTYCTSLVRRVATTARWSTIRFPGNLVGRALACSHCTVGAAVSPLCMPTHAVALAIPCTPLPCSYCAAQPFRLAPLCCTKSWRCWRSYLCRRGRFCGLAVSLGAPY